MAQAVLDPNPAMMLLPCLDRWTRRWRIVGGGMEGVVGRQRMRELGRNKDAPEGVGLGENFPAEKKCRVWSFLCTHGRWG